MYNNGKKIGEIEESLDVARSTVYYVLEQAGVKPNRLARRGRIYERAVLPREDFDSALAWALARIEQLERENAHYRAIATSLDALLQDFG